MTAIDLIAPPVPLPKPRSPVLGPRRKILHFAKTARVRKFRLSPEIETCADAAGAARWTASRLGRVPDLPGAVNLLTLWDRKVRMGRRIGRRARPIPRASSFKLDCREFDFRSLPRGSRELITVRGNFFGL
jgi:hypothetical protein